MLRSFLLGSLTVAIYLGLLVRERHVDIPEHLLNNHAEFVAELLSEEVRDDLMKLVKEMADFPTNAADTKVSRGKSYFHSSSHNGRTGIIGCAIASTKRILFLSQRGFLHKSDSCAQSDSLSIIEFFHKGFSKYKSFTLKKRRQHCCHNFDKKFDIYTILRGFCIEIWQRF
jgi:hypothetical protein